jgi:hypothetical protein
MRLDPHLARGQHLDCNGLYAVRLGEISVQPLCSLCLCGCCIVHSDNHRDTENTEVAQRNPRDELHSFASFFTPLRLCGKRGHESADLRLRSARACTYNSGAPELYHNDHGPAC